VFGRTVDVLVGRLRRKLTGPDGARAIETVRGCGYRFALDVQWHQSAAS
jgi:DNA-binding response OmpR family regulator